jgi:hypothetical protein
VARARRLEARRAGAARARAPAPLEPAARHLGPLGDPRQPGRGARRPGADARREPRRREWPPPRGACAAPAPGPHRQAPRDRRAHPGIDRALSVGGSPGDEAAPGRRRRDRGRDHDARLHQHPLAGGALVPRPPRRPSRLGGADRPAPRVARPRPARLGRAGAQGGPAQGGRVHLQPRPRRRLPPGRARAAARQPEGRRATAPACGPVGSRPRTALARDLRADARLRAPRGGRRASRSMSSSSTSSRWHSAAVTPSRRC